MVTADPVATLGPVMTSVLAVAVGLLMTFGNRVTIGTRIDGGYSWQRHGSFQPANLL